MIVIANFTLPNAVSLSALLLTMLMHRLCVVIDKLNLPRSRALDRAWVALYHVFERAIFSSISRRDRLRYTMYLLIKQNDPKYEENIKRFSEVFALDRLDQYELMQIPIEELIYNQIQTLQAYLSRVLSSFIAQVKEAKLYKLFVRKSSPPTITAQYTVKYIYLNGGFVNHA